MPIKATDQTSYENELPWSKLKGALDKFNIIPQLFQKKLGFLYH